MRRLLLTTLVVLASLAGSAPAAAATLVSRRLAGLPVPVTPSSHSEPARWPVSADGRFVVFATSAGDVATPTQSGTQNVFVRDVQSGSTALVSVNAAGSAPGNGTSWPVAISADGRYVLFDSNATNLAPTTTNGAINVFVRDVLLQTTELVSVNAAGTGSGNGSSTAVAMSPDARFVLFSSLASNLVAIDANGGISDAFVRDRQTTSTTLASVSSAEAPGDDHSYAVALDSDGRYVVFDSSAGNLAPADANGTADVFRRDLQTGTTELVSVDGAGTAAGNDISRAVATSANGRFVLFSSQATDLVTTPDGNLASDVFVRDLQAAVTILVSVNAAGTAAGESDSVATAISDDGRHVAFWSLANDLVAGDAGHSDVFARDLQINTTALESRGGGGPGNADSTMSPGRMSGDGRFVLFDSHASNLAAGDGNGEPDVFLRDRQLGTTTLVSAKPGGQPGNGSSGGSGLTPDGRYVVLVSNATDLVVGDDLNDAPDVFERDVQAAATALVSARGPLPAPATGNRGASADAITGDGRYVLFSSAAGDLVSGDGNLESDVFVRDLETGTTALASRNAAGAGVGNGPSTGADVSLDGRYVLFSSDADDLVAAGIDGNASQDAFVRDQQMGTTALVSATPGGASGDSRSAAHAITLSGRYALFVSGASDLAAGDDNGDDDVFLRDLQTGVTELVSVSFDGSGSGNWYSEPVAITPDGRWVLFDSGSTDLVALSGHGFRQVYVRDRQTGTTEMVSANAHDGSGGNGHSSGAAITPDGRYVVFSGGASDVIVDDENGLDDVFVRDRQTGTTTMVSRDVAGNGASHASYARALSADGRYVLFDSFASDLVPNFDPNGRLDVFRRDLQSGSTVLVSVNGTGGTGLGASVSVGMSADGRIVAFESSAGGLVSGDANGVSDVFVRDMMTGTTTLMSATPGGVAGSGDSFGCCLATNGTRVAFQSFAPDLVANDFNGTSDAFAAATGHTPPSLPFADGFESGNFGAWSALHP